MYEDTFKKFLISSTLFFIEVLYDVVRTVDRWVVATSNVSALVWL